MKAKMIIRNARIATLDGGSQVIDSGAVEIGADGSIGRVGTGIGAGSSEIVDAEGRLLMPALINCHTHLYSTLARGMKLRTRPPANFLDILKKVWWRLDSALEDEDIYYSALVGLMDSAKAGVGTVIDHHSSPKACAGSLDIVERAFREVGLRGALCYETSDRHGTAQSAEAIAENVRFICKHRDGEDTIGANFGLHASFTLSDRTLRRCVEVNQAGGAGFHVHVGEDGCDVRHAKKLHYASPVRRLAALGVLDSKTLAAHCVRVSPGDIRCLVEHEVNVVQNPQSNCNNAVGIMNRRAFSFAGMSVGLGSDGFSPRIWEEFLTAYHAERLGTRDPRPSGIESWHSVLLNNRAIARKVWGWELGRVTPGARADLMLLDYFPPTTLTGDNLFGHVLFGIAHAPVDSLMVNGKWVIREHRFVNLDERAICEQAAARARKLWERL